ncbi:hypothetical protein Fleli_0975 [Bernardetia litoralis DSM 6794]|uniref:Lipoprotein n=1 Tax=Bernardetia litoralis (strain ATCC 23117 / DSM 6794 / NBRC 15988 / NCIMB 1366 / Fx l1 / Sio-4) TaxID=880071 RepID=I4AHI9_BERLS|nr:hypothetical protein [Bernardetia litoralis]AFM03424.1 hypothetical protein Fleli_0975 [Bernardetia litoralis DSM 6794]
MRKLLFSCFVLFIFLCAKCEDDTPKNPIDLLPPVTQTGANTFGCLVDGEAFTPDGTPLSLINQYTYSNDGYYFSVSGSKSGNGFFKSIGLATEELEFGLEQGNTYNLTEIRKNNAYATYYFYSTHKVNGVTSEQYTGEMTITRFNDNVIAGTFWFDVLDTDGVIHQIREGRFDVKK